MQASERLKLLDSLSGDKVPPEARNSAIISVLRQRARLGVGDLLGALEETDRFLRIVESWEEDDEVVLRKRDRDLRTQDRFNLSRFKQGKLFNDPEEGAEGGGEALALVDPALALATERQLMTVVLCATVKRMELVPRAQPAREDVRGAMMAALDAVTSGTAVAPKELPMRDLSKGTTDFMLKCMSCNSHADVVTKAALALMMEALWKDAVAFIADRSQIGDKNSWARMGTHIALTIAHTITQVRMHTDPWYAQFNVNKHAIEEEMSSDVADGGGGKKRGKAGNATLKQAQADAAKAQADAEAERRLRELKEAPAEAARRGTADQPSELEKALNDCPEGAWVERFLKSEACDDLPCPDYDWRDLLHCALQFTGCKEVQAFRPDICIRLERLDTCAELLAAEFRPRIMHKHPWLDMRRAPLAELITAVLVTELPSAEACIEVRQRTHGHQNCMPQQFRVLQMAPGNLHARSRRPRRIKNMGKLTRLRTLRDELRNVR